MADRSDGHRLPATALVSNSLLNQDSLRLPFGQPQKQSQLIGFQIVMSRIATMTQELFTLTYFD